MDVDELVKRVEALCDRVERRADAVSGRSFVKKIVSRDHSFEFETRDDGFEAEYDLTITCNITVEPVNLRISADQKAPASALAIAEKKLERLLASGEGPRIAIEAIAESIA